MLGQPTFSGVTATKTIFDAKVVHKQTITDLTNAAHQISKLEVVLYRKINTNQV